jgi:hypothetical protein
MKHYAIFYQLRDGRYVEPCGDRKIVRLDGRLSYANMKALAHDVGKQRGFDAYTVERGQRLDRLFCLTVGPQPINGKES